MEMGLHSTGFILVGKTARKECHSFIDIRSGDVPLRGGLCLSGMKGHRAGILINKSGDKYRLVNV